jgi:hypothetical protein
MGKTSEAQKRATAKWMKEHKEHWNEQRKARVVRLAVSFNNVTEKTYLNIWKTIPNKAEYMKNCLDEYEAKYGE